MPSVVDRLALRPAELADLPAMLALNRRFYGDESWVTEEFFRWRYGETPAGRPITWLACDGETLAGSYSVFPVRLWAGGREYNASVSFATLMNPDYATVVLRQGGKLQTLFTALAERAYGECRERGIVLTYAFPNARSHAGFVRQLGFAQLDVLRFRACPLRFAPLIVYKAPRLRPIAWLLAGVLRPGFRAWYRVGARPRGGTVAERDFDDGCLDALWAGARSSWPVTLVRDRAYFRWRFATNPFARYHLLVADARDGAARRAPRGALVYTRQVFQDRQRGRQVEAGAIADWLVPNSPNGRAALRELLREAVHRLRAAGVPLVIAADNGDASWATVFRSAGFYTFAPSRAPRQFPFILRRHIAAGTLPELDDPRQWLVTFGDNDVV